MSIHRVLLGVLTMLCCTTVCAQKVTVASGTYHGWGAERLMFNHQVRLQGGRNHYRLNYLQYLPNKSGRTKTFVNLSAPRTAMGFGREPINFLDMRVNGIPLSDLQPVHEDVSIDQANDSCKATFSFNFNGARIFMDSYMTSDSPLLFLAFRPAEKQLEPIRSIRIRLSAIVSRLLTKQGKTIWTGPYHRQGKSSQRILNQQRPPFQIGRDEEYLILYDLELDGTKSDGSKGYGPSFLTFEGKDVKEIRLFLDNNWISHIDFELKPDFRCCRLALWQWAHAMSNSDFEQWFKREPKIFRPFDRNE